ncbi:MAG TPA: bifunctional methylenetetrahydrofolate dehydrogenase/methenyltetrahydrofolate cyclohydrolase FolD [Acidimicrobiaceae bacterium]|nr:bifunctional methylenetetrahydrofolate dehydrogenase/methenyltetrahydrofolate cyclohydrolase FolD [Myxococcales bacterium]HAN07011.1 bifunctional methylenetetrahydrofolate dehydrogenase/methenyltetrahydrofolate cyclohydrolase FolD [Acidimicrobiaceae bacterium]
MSQPALKIDGRAIAKRLKKSLSNQVQTLRDEHRCVPCLAVVLVGQDPASSIYVAHKIKACERVGIRSLCHRLDASTEQAELMEVIDTLNSDPEVDGILVQLPLPAQLDAAAVTQAVRADKDVDGFSESNLGALLGGANNLVACTPQGIMHMLKETVEELGESLSGKHAVVIGRSVTVGRPMAILLLQANCTVTICHSRTPDTAAHTRRADVVIAAAGRPELVRSDWIKPGAIVIDVGIHRRDDGSLCGDVHWPEVSARAGALSPVPGGVGPMTIAQLLANTVDACRKRRGLSR